MKTLELAGYRRETTGSKSENKKNRTEGLVPCVLYGGAKPIHFKVPTFLFRDIVYTPNVYEINMDIEGEIHRCVLQDVQFHPVSDSILHADFLELNDVRPIRMEVPIRFEGVAPGISQGGKLVEKLRKIKVKGLPHHIPDAIVVDITSLELGKSIKIGSLPPADYQILNSPLVTIASIIIPRALKGK
jgi:large subunit ribosomal protein L25